MTARLPMLGLLAMALSHGIGGGTQRPLAIVIIAPCLGDISHAFGLAVALSRYRARRRASVCGADHLSLILPPTGDARESGT